ncbi:hypothetical protein PCE1_003677 [Barthelona sp. PCE]
MVVGSFYFTLPLPCFDDESDSLDDLSLDIENFRTGQIEKSEKKQMSIDLGEFLDSEDDFSDIPRVRRSDSGGLRQKVQKSHTQRTLHDFYTGGRSVEHFPPVKLPKRPDINEKLRNSMDSISCALIPLQQQISSSVFHTLSSDDVMNIDHRTFHLTKDICYKLRSFQDHVTQLIGEVQSIEARRPKINIKNLVNVSQHKAFDDIFTDEIRYTNTTVFGNVSFRPDQEKVIQAVLRNLDVFILFPTGAGKSLTFQLPAVIQTNVTVVFSPLIALMNDQIEALKENNVRAERLVSMMTDPQRHMEVLRMFRNPSVKLDLLYCSPEMFDRSQDFQVALEEAVKAGRVARFVVDEAHCISQWGHDFRVAYKNLSTLRERFPNVPVTACTATASKAVISEIIGILDMADPFVVKQSLNRPNISYKFIQCTSKDDLVSMLRRLLSSRFRNQSVIVYVLKRATAEDIYARLEGHKVAYYHAGLEPDMRQMVEKQWKTDEINVIVATVAFGMGVDKADVRGVIHTYIPKSVEHFLQESGRAGRDRQPAESIVLFQPQDCFDTLRLIMRPSESQTMESKDHKMRVMFKLLRMANLCLNSTECHRKQLLALMNEDDFSVEQCNGTCAACKVAHYDTVDIRDDIALVAQAVKEICEYTRAGEKGIGRSILPDVLRGSRAKKIRNLNLSALNCYNKGSRMKAAKIYSCLVLALYKNVVEPVVDVSGQYPIIRFIPGAECDRFLESREPWMVRWTVDSSQAMLMDDSSETQHLMEIAKLTASAFHQLCTGRKDSLNQGFFFRCLKANILDFKTAVKNKFCLRREDHPNMKHVFKLMKELTMNPSMNGRRDVQRFIDRINESNAKNSRILGSAAIRTEEIFSDDSSSMISQSRPSHASHTKKPNIPRVLHHTPKPSIVWGFNHQQNPKTKKTLNDLVFSDEDSTEVTLPIGSVAPAMLKNTNKKEIFVFSSDEEDDEFMISKVQFGSK